MWEIRIIGGEMKFSDTNRTGYGEGIFLCKNWRWGTKPGGNDKD